MPLHPTLQEQLDDPYGFWTPWNPPAEVRRLKAYQKAKAEGWADWIANALDVEAIKQGYVFDVSRDRKGRAVYWHYGAWVRHVPGRKKLEIIDPEDEDLEIAYCGRGDHACRFLELFLRHTKEPLVGQPLRLLPWHRFATQSIFGWVHRDSRYRRFSLAMLETGKKNSKALALDTLVPTPTGWTTMGEVQIGDTVFDENGNQCTVTAATEINQQPVSYEVRFSNGEVVRACKDHLWCVESLTAKVHAHQTFQESYNRRCPRNAKGYRKQTLTTEELAACVRRHDGAKNHRLQMHQGIECDARRFPVPPYILGLWLGDGTSVKPELTCAGKDRVHYQQALDELGWFAIDKEVREGIHNLSFHRKCKTFFGEIARDKGNTVKLLKSLGVFGNKHIPAIYLRASKEQRIELLRGLMDTDGSVDKSGKCFTYVTKLHGLCEGVCELLASLGVKYSVKQVDSRPGKDGPVRKYWFIQFSVYREMLQPFRLPRKAERVRSLESNEMTPRSRTVHIDSIEPIEPVPMRCIQVDSTSGQFLIGKTMIPTHNSSICSGYAILGIRADGEHKAQVYGAASDRKQARIVFDESRDFVKACDLSDEIHIVDSQSRLLHLESGSVYTVLSSDAFRNEGIDASLVIFDELHAQPNRKLFSVLRRAGRARRQPLTVVVTTYGKTLSSIWGEVHLRCKRILEGTSNDWRTFVLIASAEEIPVIVTEPVKVGQKKITVQRLIQPIDKGQVIELELPGGPAAEEDQATDRKVKVTVAEHARRGSEELRIAPAAVDIPQFSEGKGNTDWKSDHAIRCANPAVGIVFEIDKIRADIAESIGSPEAEAECKQLSLNIVSGGGKRWLSHAAWSSCGSTVFRPSELVGGWCWGGFDSSFVNDLTAFWLAFPNWPADVPFENVLDPKIRLIGLAWVPREGIEDREEREEFPYRAVAERKYIGDFAPLRICDGATIDYEQVGSDIIEFVKPYNVRGVAYDPAYASFVIQPHLIQKAGLPCITHRQGAMSMGPPTKWFQSLVLSRKLNHGNHPMLDRAIEGAVLHSPDRAGNRYPSKDKSTSRIDPLIAAVMATGWCITPPKFEPPSGAYSDAPGAGVFD